MRRLGLVFFALAAQVSCASWYWPFGSDEDDTKQPRISELMEPASILIDKATDFADEGKIEEAVAEYRKALAELDRIELENPERAATQKFATLRNKRAYVNSHIDTLLLEEVMKNSAQIAITDTTELEKLYEKMKEEERRAKEEVKRKKAARKSKGDAKFVDDKINGGKDSKSKSKDDDKDSADKDKEKKEDDKESETTKKGRKARLALAVEDIEVGDFAAASAIIAELLEEKPNDEAALNLRARLEMLSGDNAKAQDTLYQCIISNPQSYYAYYNMARIILAVNGKKGRKTAGEYYKMGREMGGPTDEDIEEGLK